MTTDDEKCQQVVGGDNSHQYSTFVVIFILMSWNIVSKEDHCYSI